MFRGGVTAAVDVTGVEAVVRSDAALLEDDLAEFLGSLTASVGGPASVYGGAVRRSLYEPVADAVGSKVGQQALPPTAGAPGGRAPLRPSMVYWAYRNYRGFPDETGETGETDERPESGAAGVSGEGPADLAVVRRAAVAVRILLKAAVALDDIQDGDRARWAGFTARLNAVLADSEAQDRVLEAAHRAYDHVAVISRALSTGLGSPAREPA